MERSSVLSPSYLRRPDSYDRLGAPPGSDPQRFLANRLLAGAANSPPGKHHLTVSISVLLFNEQQQRVKRAC